MDKQQAVHIIEETFKNSFNEERFTRFIRELFNEVDEDKAFTMAGNLIPDAYENHVKLYKRIAKYTDPEGNELDIIAVNLKKDSSIERARTMQRNFLAWYLKNRGEKDSALVAYYTEGVEDWRFSYVRMDYRLEQSEKGKIKVKTDLTPARRYSFLVGKHEPNHTAQQQLVPILQDTKNNPTLSQIEQAFNIETVTNEFFEYYKELFTRLRDHIEKEFKKSRLFHEELSVKGIDAVSFTKKLLGQIVFLYFIQKKGWLGVPKDKTWGKGDRQFLRTLLQQAIVSKKNFYADVLEYLFYEALAVEHRGSSDASYYPRFDCKIPFLNGGLFEADFDWEKTEVSIPNSFFTNGNKTDRGDIGDGILDVFDRYNFTVKEDEPLDKEIALDPELLGKTFERMLEVKDRKSKGAYYTPREIVHYMCEESLINYLDVTLNEQPAAYSKLGDQQTDAFGNKAKKGQLDIEAEVGSNVKVPRNEIEEFIRHGIAAIENDAHVESEGRETRTYSYQLPQSIRTYASDIDKALETIRICDPAIGSGAFPVGMMSEIVQARYILEHTYLKRGKTSYDFKRHAIQECIYGVDIDHSAIDIAKLRLWLSLVVDEEDFYKIKPLPNLDYKIVEGNSLIGLPYVSQQMEALEKLKEQFFDETNAKEKANLREKINHEIYDILKRMSKQAKYEINFDFELFFSEVFREKNGFDVVIGNPPYLESRHPSFSDTYKDILQQAIISRWSADASYITRGADLLVYFFETALYVIGKRGSVVLITQNSWLDTEYGKKIQEFLIKKTCVKAIIDSDYKYFDSSTGPNINTVISIFIGRQKIENDSITFARVHQNFSDVGSMLNYSKDGSEPSGTDIHRYPFSSILINTIKWGVLLSTPEEIISILDVLNTRALQIDKLKRQHLSFGQGLNLNKEYLFERKAIRELSIPQNAIIPILTSDDDAPFCISSTKYVIANRKKIDTQIARALRQRGYKIFDPDNTGKTQPILIMPRGLGRHFCAFNSIGSYSASCVDVYDKEGTTNEELRLNLWLCLNSSICWLWREMNGRKNLGGGMLKAEAVDMKTFPVYMDLNCSEEIKKIFVQLQKRCALETVIEIDSDEHRKIDQIIFEYLGLQKESARIVAFLKSMIINRTRKSKT
jgi:hypothetical protein